MKPNMGILDKAIRVLLASMVGVLYFTGILGGVAAAILGTLAAIFFATSLFSFCPLYLPLRISTRKKEEPSSTEGT